MPSSTKATVISSKKKKNDLPPDQGHAAGVQSIFSLLCASCVGKVTALYIEVLAVTEGLASGWTLFDLIFSLRVM